MTFASKRLATDAKIVLERAGYYVEYGAFGPNRLVAGLRNTRNFTDLPIIGGCVDNAEVEKLLAAATGNI